MRFDAKVLVPFIFVGTILFSSSCKNTGTNTHGKEAEPEFVTQPFSAEFTGTYVHAGPDTFENKKCIDSLSAWRAVVDCAGHENTIGKIRVHFDFCGDAEGQYGNMNAYMVEENNDTLFINIKNGKVIQGKTNVHEKFVTSFWKDNFEFTGGTGKFENASGGGMTDDYNSSEDNNSHHRWTGSITIKKNNPS